MSTLADKAALVELMGALVKSTAEQDLATILDELKKIKATEDLLRETKAGLAVGKLRSHASKSISEQAKELVKKWRNDVEEYRKALNQPKPAAKPAIAKPTIKPAVAKRLSISSATSPTTPTTPGQSKTEAIARSVKIDGARIPPLGDKAREKCLELIYDALCIDTGIKSDIIMNLSAEIEKIVFNDQQQQTNPAYRNKMRSLFLNLKDKSNPGLRASVLSGDLSPAKLCGMSAQDMASADRKEADKLMQEKNFHNSLGVGEQQAETDAFQCGRCKQRKTIYRQAQTRSADEPMTTFVTCMNCNHRWKFS